MKVKQIPDHEFVLTAMDPEYKALIVMPYRDSDDLDPRVRAWLVPEGEDRPMSEERT